LTLLTALEQTRRHVLAQAAVAAADGDGAETLVHAETAHRLRADAESWCWLAVGSLLARDFALALACYRQTRTSEV
jgi:hypothetical protein